MRRWLTLALPMSLLIVACNDDNDPTAPSLEGPFAAMPHEEGIIAAFPSDVYTVADPQSYTGLRVSVDLTKDRDFRRGPHTNIAVQDYLNRLDGFGTTAGGWIRFSTLIDRDTVSEGTTAFFGYFEGDTPVLVPTEVSVSRSQVSFRPDLALPPNHVGFMATTTGILDTNGEAYQATPELQNILAGKNKNTGVSEELGERLRNAADAMVSAGFIQQTSDLSAITVFTTQSIHETDLEVAEKIQSTDPTILIGEEPCEDVPHENVRLCYFNIEIANFVSADHTIADNAADLNETYIVQATLFLPRPEDAPYEIPYDPQKGFPVAVFGHGLTGEAHQAVQIARYTAPLGIATIGLDSPQHGTHPMRISPDGEIFDVLIDLFGMNISSAKMAIQPFVLRDGWRQSSFDKLGLIQAIKKGIDVDDDELPDLDASRISYLGASLGAIQGSELLALSTDIELALLSVGGARISDILRFGETFGILTPLVFPQANDAMVMRSLVLLQTALERGDGMNWAPHVMQNRLRGAEAPHLALQNSVPDAVVPTETGIQLARSLGVPIIGKAVLSDRNLDEVSAPVHANHPSGKTAGVLQMDWMHRSNDPEWKPSTHDKSPDSVEAIAYWTHIFISMYRDNRPELIDPYTLDGSDDRPQD